MKTVDAKSWSNFPERGDVDPMWTFLWTLSPLPSPLQGPRRHQTAQCCGYLPAGSSPAAELGTSSWEIQALSGRRRDTIRALHLTTFAAERGLRWTDLFCSAFILNTEYNIRSRIFVCDVAIINSSNVRATATSTLQKSFRQIKPSIV